MTIDIKILFFKPNGGFLCSSTAYGMNPDRLFPSDSCKMENDRKVTGHFPIGFSVSNQTLLNASHALALPHVQYLKQNIGFERAIKVFTGSAICVVMTFVKTFFPHISLAQVLIRLNFVLSISRQIVQTTY